MFMPYLADESEKKYKVYFIIVELIDIEVKRNKRGVIRGFTYSTISKKWIKDTCYVCKLNKY